MTEQRRDRRNPTLLGQIFYDPKLPRQEWRVCEEADGKYVLERLDKPSIQRFLDAAILKDDTRYRRRR